MARLIDENKLSAIKKALIEITVQDGSANAPIAKIAKKAGVSVGYLYRHYDSKEELISYLYHDNFEKFRVMIISKLNNHQTLKEVIFEFYKEILEMSKNEINEVLFLLKLMTDYSIAVSEELRAKLIETLLELRNKFKDEFRDEITNEQIYIQFLGSILLFINVRKRNVFSEKEITLEEIEVLAEMSVKIMK